MTLALALALGACNGDNSKLPEDASPQLQEGERIYMQRCASCHGIDGGGGVGPKLSGGAVADKYSDAAVEKSVIQNGLNSNKMPAFKDILSDEEIDSVVAYTREGL